MRRTFVRTSWCALFWLFLGCDAEPTRPDGAAFAPNEAANAPHVVASASGGANWDLLGFDLDGDGVEDPVGNILSFTAQRDADGSVKGRIQYQQSGLGEVFRFHGTVTCIGIHGDGTIAKFGGPITWTDDETIPVGVFMWFSVQDNGEGGSGTPDRSSIFGLGDDAANERFCANPAPPNPRFFSDIEHGNIRVRGGR